MRIFTRRTDNSPTAWCYGVRCSDCNRLLVGKETREPVYERLDFWSSLRLLAPVWEPICEDCR
jgi:hypothetical protein